MTPEQHKRVSEIFLAALRLDAAKREEYVRAECGSDLGVRDRVVAMLTQHVAPRLDLDTPALEASIAIDDLLAGLPASDAATLPSELGPYRIVDVLGTGGMGVVYRAEQQNPKRTVALKAVRPGVVGANSLRRFAHEADVLARLQHPGIAQIFEAGAVIGESDARQPYFAMELIDGEPLTTYADRNHLTILHRVAMLADICDAVHHAHTKGVIHRDLKPNNILVDRSGRPKVLDFGVARIIDADAKPLTTHTHASQIIGTLPYMSPEQVSGDARDVDTRCDVYALGVVGYELLRGQPPYDMNDKSIPEAARMITESIPPRLGRFARALAGDLETIIHKALEKDPARRYLTAGELGADLRRFLAHEPIVARPPTLGYQLVKFARRHRLAVSALALAGLAIIVGVAGLIRGGMIASKQRSEAQRQVKIARAINDFLNNDLLVLADPMFQPGKDITMKEALDRAARSVASRFPQEDEVRAAIEFTLGRTYMALGDYGAADAHLNQALTLHQLLYDTDDSQALTASESMVTLLRRTGRLDEATALAEQTLEACKKIHGDNHRDTLAALDSLGMVRLERGESDQAEALFKQAIEGLQDVAPGDELLFRVRGNLAGAYKWQGRLDDATPLNESLVAGARTRWGDNDPRTATALNNLATLYLRQGKFAESQPLLEEAIDIASPVLGENHPDVLTFMGNLGTALMNLEAYDEAATLLETVYDRTQQSLGELSAETVMNGQALATVYRYLHRYDEARRIYEQALKAANAALGEQHPQSLYLRSYLGLTLTDLEQYEAAETMMRETVELYRQALGESHLNTLHADNDLATLLVKINRPAEAEAIYERILATSFDESPHAAIARAIFQTGYGRCLTALGRYADAEAQLTAAQTALEDTQWATGAYGREVLNALVELYESWGVPEKLKLSQERLAALPE